jgi:hypothetical protein
MKPPPKVKKPKQYKPVDLKVLPSPAAQIKTFNQFLQS